MERDVNKETQRATSNLIYRRGVFSLSLLPPTHSSYTRNPSSTRELNLEPIKPHRLIETNKMAEGEPFTYFAKIIFGIICVVWLLAIIFCTPVGRWLRSANPREARRPFYYNSARAAGDEQEAHELNELDGGSGGRSGQTRRVN